MIRRRVLFASASNYAGKLVAVLVAFALMPLLLHRLGEAQYGVWILVGSTLAYGTLLDLGIGDAVTKYVSECHSRGDLELANGIIATALALLTVLGLVALALSSALAPVFPSIFAIPSSQHDTSMLLVLLLGIQLAISIPCVVFAAILRGLQRYGLLNSTTIASQLLSAAAIVTILLNGRGVIEIAAANMLIWSTTQAMTYLCIRHVAPELHIGWRRARRDLVRSVFSFSLAMFAIHAAGRVQSKSDEIVIGVFLSAGVVAPYAIARRLSGLPQLLSEQFLKIFVPLASQFNAENDLRRLRSLYLVGTRLTLVILIPVAGVLVALAGDLLTLWIGPDYVDYAPIVVILTLASLIETSQWPGMSILQGIARHHRLAAVWVCTAAANLALSLVLVRAYGAIGVAVGTLLPTAAVCLGFVLPHTMRTLGVRMRDMLTAVFVPAILPVMPMVLVFYISERTLATHSLPSVLCTAALGTTAYLSGYLSLAGDFERELIHSFARKVARIASVRPTHN
jgi:O-antigen/teichoic acid export membrane protein